MNDHVRGEDLAAYVDGLLDTARKNELEGHFARCPQCLEELADLSVIMGKRDRIPARFLEQALGRKSKPAPAPLRLRLLFEVAAALLVVVFIGYFYLSNNRFWQPSEKQTPADAMKENAGAPDFRAPAPPAVIPGEQTESDHLANGSQAPKKETRAPMNKDASAAAGQALSADKEKGAPPQIAPVMPQPAAEVESSPNQELQRVELKSKAFDPARRETAARSRPAAQALDLNAVQIQQNQLQQKQAAGAAQTAGPEKKLNENLGRNADAGQLQAAPVRIGGDVAWSNLQNPELILAWSWFPKELVLELLIDSAGTVTAVVTSGKSDERLAAQAASEAKKLIFAISEKKSRRARLVAKDAPPD